MSTAPTPLRQTDRKRQAILAAAIAAFRADGFEASSMDKIAAAAGVSKRTVYNHFPSKDELFAQILRQLWDSSAAQLAPAYQNGVALRPQLLALLRQKMALLQDSHFLDLARVAIAEAIHSPQRAQAMVARLSDKEEGVLAWLRAAQADGQLLRAEPGFAAAQLQGLLKTFAFWPQITMGQPALEPAMQEQVVTAAVDMFLACYG